MFEFLNDAAAVAILAAGFSVCYDFVTREKRLGMWEITHPGLTYIRNYRSLT